ncbi:flagellar hook-basal body complex protein FliE [Treponema sp.]|uniref:flagellar hook-basal body complex protein FliE n=1 Tax=Treponema sp. TaxID=166 RepID=UPI003F00AEFD
MNFSFGSLELNRTNPAHIGTSAIGSVDSVLRKNENLSVSDTDRKESFKAYLLEAASEMNRQQIEVSAMQEKVITDPDSVDIHDVTTAMAKAQMSMELAQTVIDRLVKGWTELSQNR